MPRVAIALGSNIGDREANISAAISELKSLATTGEPFLTASLFDTAPQDCPPDSPRFLNTVIDLHFSGNDPLELLALTQAIEVKLGRTAKSVRNAPRVIDIDLLIFGDVTHSSESLELPHPRIREREFVLQPLREIRPFF